ncbi:unnamed protein product [Caenorhabditis brenneri]
MTFPKQLLVSIVFKILIVILTIVTLVLLDPAYTTAYISINYEIVIIYLVSGLTLLYCIVSILVSIYLAKRSEDTSLTNCSFSEIILAAGGIMGWLIIIGMGGTISQRTSSDTGDRFGWIRVTSALNFVCFLVILAVFATKIVREKILHRETQENKYRGVYVQ